MKKRKLVTLNERLNKDMFFIVPLTISIIYLATVQMIIEWKCNVIISSNSVDRVSIFLSILNIFYAFRSVDSLDQVKTAYINLLNKDDKKIQILHDIRIDCQIIFAFINYILNLIRFIHFAKMDDVIDYNNALFSVTLITGLMCYSFVSDARRSISKLINNNANRFYD